MRDRQYDLPPLDRLVAFEAAARHLSFTRAADELALTQSAVSRQVASLEEHFGVPLFHRLHRALRLSDEGVALQRAVLPALQQLHDVNTALRQRARHKTLVVSTTAGFAGLWLIPRLGGFTASRPDVDVRISASSELVNLNRDGVDLAIRYLTDDAPGADALRLLGDSFVPVCSPRLLRDKAHPLKAPQDLRHHCLLHMDYGPGSELLDWPLWLRAMGVEGLVPASVLHFSQYDQMIQAAVNAQGVAVGRMPLVNDLIERRQLIMPFNETVVSPRSYYLLQSAAAQGKAQVREFVAWLRAEAASGAATGSGPGSAARADRARA